MSHRFGTVMVETKLKLNACECCERAVGRGINKTALHHIFYDIDNPEKYTIELCYRCHMQYHNLKGEYGDLHRQNIRNIAIKNWGELNKDTILYENREKAEIRHKLQSDKYKSGEKALTHKEYEKLIEVVDNLEDELLIKMAIFTGLRREDLCNVLIKNIDLENKLLTFHESKKNKDPTIHLQDSLIILTKKFLKTIPTRTKLFSFVGRTAYRHFNYWCRIAGIYERPFHALRATCVKFSHDAGWNDEQIQALTGDSLRVIQEHYRTPSTDEMRDVTNNKPIIRCD